MDDPRVEPLDAGTADEALLDEIVRVEHAVAADEEPDAPPLPRTTVVGLLRHGWGLARLHHALVRTPGGRVAGYATVALRDHDNTHAAEVAVRVDPAARRRGTGTSLLTWATGVARQEGRRLLLAEALLDGPGAGFLRRHGFDVACLDRRSTCVLADVPGAAAATPAPAGYAVLRLDSRGLLDGPAEQLAAYAGLKLVLNDAPLQQLEWEPEVWEPDHARAYLEGFAQRDQHLLVAVARHEATGEWAGLTEVMVTPGAPALAEQEDTSVVRAHRGHGLGLALKADMVRRLRADHPGVERVGTWNAHDNAWMLAVNDALGYGAPVTWAEWQRPTEPSDPG